MNKFMLIILLVAHFQAVNGEHHSGHQHVEHAHHRGHDAKQPSLNHGAKWLMDHHTRVMFETMSQRVAAGGDFKTMGVELHDDLQKLIQGCTMTGAAHDQLHVFLLPYMSSVKALSETGSKEAYSEVKQGLKDYQKYFE